MAEEKKGGKTIQQDPYVGQMRPDPSAPPSAVLVLEGLAGDSDRADWVRLYLNRSLTYYAEFRREDVAFVEDVPAEESKIAGRKATRAGLRQDAVVEYTRTTRAQPGDAFDLDVQLAAGKSPTAAAVPATHTCANGCVSLQSDCVCPTDVTCHTCQTRCNQATCHTCQTRCGQATCAATCQTCQTQCGQPTCAGTCNTCQTQCNQQTCVTCQTCQTHCNQATCHTCQTRCGQDTCVTCHTCDTCNPHVHTCGPHCLPQ